MKPAPDRSEERAHALMRLERTRLQWALRTAQGAAGAGDERGGAFTDAWAASPLNAVLSEWLANEIEARLWPEAAHGEAGQPDGSTEGEATPPVHRPPPSQLMSEALSDWTRQHPWQGVLTGLLAGGLAMSQRQRLLQWAIASALPWLVSNVAVIALPMVAQWMQRQAPDDAPAPPSQQDSPDQGEGGTPPDVAPPGDAQTDVASGVNPVRSAA